MLVYTVCNSPIPAVFYAAPHTPNSPSAFPFSERERKFDFPIEIYFVFWDVWIPSLIKSFVTRLSRNTNMSSEIRIKTSKAGEGGERKTVFRGIIQQNNKYMPDIISVQLQFFHLIHVTWAVDSQTRGQHMHRVKYINNTIIYSGLARWQTSARCCALEIYQSKGTQRCIFNWKLFPPPRLSLSLSLSLYVWLIKLSVWKVSPTTTIRAPAFFPFLHFVP